MTEVPGGLLSAVKVEGLRQPLSLALRQHQEVLQVKVGWFCVDSALISYRSCLTDRSKLVDQQRDRHLTNDSGGQKASTHHAAPQVDMASGNWKERAQAGVNLLVTAADLSLPHV